MREIKFRGIQRFGENKGKWAFGSLLILGLRHSIVPIPPKHETPADDITLFAQVCERVEVDAETIGQYTGRKDKNGKEEIYEGDRIKGTVHDLKSYSEEERPDLWSEYIVRFGVGEVDASDYEQYEVEILGFYLEKVKPNNWAAGSILGLNGIEIIGTIHDKE